MANHTHHHGSFLQKENIRITKWNWLCQFQQIFISTFYVIHVADQIMKGRFWVYMDHPCSCHSSSPNCMVICQHFRLSRSFIQSTGFNILHLTTHLFWCTYWWSIFLFRVFNMLHPVSSFPQYGQANTIVYLASSNALNLRFPSHHTRWLSCKIALHNKLISTGSFQHTLISWHHHLQSSSFKIMKYHTSELHFSQVREAGQ